MLTCAGGERNRGLGRLGQGRRWHSPFAGCSTGFQTHHAPHWSRICFFSSILFAIEDTGGYPAVYGRNLGIVLDSSGSCTVYFQLVHVQFRALSIPSHADHTHTSLGIHSRCCLPRSHLHFLLSYQIAPTSRLASQTRIPCASSLPTGLPHFR